jgi:hypothetical protein
MNDRKYLKIIIGLFIVFLSHHGGYGHWLTIQDSTGNSYAKAHVALGDSLFFSSIQTPNAPSLNRSQNNSFFMLDVSGVLAKQISFHTNIHVFTETGNTVFPYHDYQPMYGIPYNIQNDTIGATSSTVRTWDYFTATTQWDAGWIEFIAGLDYLRFGPAQRNPLVWSGNEQIIRPWQLQNANIPQRAPVLFVGFVTSIKNIEYSQYSGMLKHYKHIPKYFHTHRLQYQHKDFFTLGLQETVLYGSYLSDTLERNMELVYSLPFVPYFFAEHYNGDRDNMAMSIDVTIKPMANLSYYAELFLDDMRNPPAGLWNQDWWGNKWALSTGIEWQKDLRFLEFIWLTEYTHIEPWVYTHALGAGHNFSHFGQSIATDLGPNSQELFTSLTIHKPSLKTKLSLELSAVDKGNDRGSDLVHQHVNDIDRMDKCYLCLGATKSYLEAGISVHSQPFSFLQIRSAAYTYRGDYTGWRAEASARLMY